MVLPVSLCTRSSSSCRTSRVCASSALNGSSISRMAGSMASARARLTRCCMPPDSWCGNCSLAAPSPTSWSNDWARSPRWRRGTPWSSRPNSTLARADRHGSRFACWNTKPRSRPVPATGLPSTRISPASRRIRPWMMRNSVVLPQPLSPISDTISPSCTSKLTRRSTGNRCSSLYWPPRTRNVLDTFSTASLTFLEVMARPRRRYDVSLKPNHKLRLFPCKRESCGSSVLGTDLSAVVPAQAGTHSHQGFRYRWPCHIALLRRMGPRLRGDDSGGSLLHIFFRGDERITRRGSIHRTGSVVSGHEASCVVVKQLVDLEPARNDALLERPIDRELDRRPVRLEPERRNSLERFRRRGLAAFDDHAERLVHDIGTLTRDLLVHREHVIDRDHAGPFEPFLRRLVRLRDERAHPRLLGHVRAQNGRRHVTVEHHLRELLAALGGALGIVGIGVLGQMPVLERDPGHAIEIDPVFMFQHTPDPKPCGLRI